MYGAYVRCRSYFGNTELEARGLPSPAELAELRALAERFGDAVPPEALTREYQPPGTGDWSDARTHALAVRKNLRRAQELLREAGWRLRAEDQRLVHATARDDRGRPMEFEFEILLQSPLFERIVLPFRQSLRKLGIEARVRTVDSSLFMNRAIAYDYDMVVASWEMTDSPGNEQRAYWTSGAADEAGGFNASGIRNPAVDEAVRRLIESPDRESLVLRTRVLDRLLQWGIYGIPCWYLPADRIVSWDRLDRPAVTPMNGTSFLFWWVDPEKDRTFADRLRAVRGR
jgi:microcin C transport system substrate-binding protein